jgi:hypothetical protein
MMLQLLLLFNRLKQINLTSQIVNNVDVGHVIRNVTLAIKLIFTDMYMVGWLRRSTVRALSNWRQGRIYRASNHDSLLQLICFICSLQNRLIFMNSTFYRANRVLRSEE